MKTTYTYMSIEALARYAWKAYLVDDNKQFEMIMNEIRQRSKKEQREFTDRYIDLFTEYEVSSW